MVLFVQLRLRRWSIGGHQPSRPNRAESDHRLAATDEELRSPRPFHPFCYDTRSQIKLNPAEWDPLRQNPPTCHLPPPLSNPLCGWYWVDINRTTGSRLDVTAGHRLR